MNQTRILPAVLGFLLTFASAACASSHADEGSESDAGMSSDSGSAADASQLADGELSDGDTDMSVWEGTFVPPCDTNVQLDDFCATNGARCGRTPVDECDLGFVYECNEHSWQRLHEQRPAEHCTVECGTFQGDTVVCQPSSGYCVTFTSATGEVESSCELFPSSCVVHDCACVASAGDEPATCDDRGSGGVWVTY